MKYYKQVQNGYILAVGIGSAGADIAKPEYDMLSEIIQNKPVPQTGYDYHLLEDLTWEEYKLPDDPTPVEPTIEDKAEAYDILMGVSE